MRNEILSLLKNNDNYVSGEKISEILNISRAAVCKHINRLRASGYLIEACSNKGYRLIDSPDLITFEEIKENLTTDFIGRKLVHFDTIDSTNAKAKELARLGEAEGTVIVSEEQTNGRGRLGRSWVSPKYKNIYMSIILRPQVEPYKAAIITQVAGAAVSMALNELDIKTYVKWPNDIVLNNKKVCGTLTEMSAEMSKINYIIPGIGINVNSVLDDFPSDVQDIATSIKISTQKEASRKILLAKILNNFEKLYLEFIHSGSAKTAIDYCRKNSALIGHDIKIMVKDKLIEAKAIDLSDSGELIVKHSDGSLEHLISNEVSMHGLYFIK